VKSEAVIVALPTVFKVTLKDCVPPASAVLAGNVAFASLEVRVTVSVTLVTVVPVCVHGFDVTWNALPAVWAEGEPEHRNQRDRHRDSHFE